MKISHGMAFMSIWERGGSGSEDVIVGQWPRFVPSTKIALNQLMLLQLERSFHNVQL